ncbi:Uncharacterised protein [Chlamydia trachomatis]|nr:Uncharacterised protein [Chlamydia trachomatis]
MNLGADELAVITEDELDILSLELIELSVGLLDI